MLIRINDELTVNLDNVETIRSDEVLSRPIPGTAGPYSEPAMREIPATLLRFRSTRELFLVGGDKRRFDALLEDLTMADRAHYRPIYDARRHDPAALDAEADSQ